MRIVLCAAILGVMLSGCAQKRTNAAARSAAPTPAAAPVGQEEKPATDVQEKQPRIREAGVYVDGKQVGVLRKNELPPSLKSHTVNLGEGYTTLRWSFVEYAASVGIDTKKIRGLHLYGGKRVSTVDAAELARLGDTLRFGFTMGDRGKAKVIWPAVELHDVGSPIDMLSAVAFYIEKEPPHRDHFDLVMPDGTKVDDNKMPYELPDANSGTRVYVDGALVGAVKRKKLTNDLLVSKDDEASRFSLLGYAGTLGVDTQHAKAVDLLAGDDVIAHIADAHATSFRVPQRNQGKILVDLPEGTAKVSAVQFYVKTKPPVRSVTKLDDAPAAAPGSGSRQGQGQDGPGDEGF